LTSSLETTCFLQLCEETISELRTQLQAALVDLGYKSAFDSPLNEALDLEQTAMSNSTLSQMATTKFMASIHNRKIITALARDLEQKDCEIQDD
jgi:hypothetical protein